MTSISLQYTTAYVLNELEFHCLCVRNEIGRVCVRNEQCVDYCVKLHTIANTITCKDLPMWTVSGKNSWWWRQLILPVYSCRFLCYVIRFIGGHAALVNVTTLIIYSGGSRGRAGGGGGGSLLILDQTEVRGAENFFLLFPPPHFLISGSGWPGPRLIWRSGYTTDIC